MKNTINRIVILMGGVGSRLGCESAGISSKIFFITPKGLILDRIVECINEIDELSEIPLEFYLCNDTQHTDLEQYKGRIHHTYIVHKIDRSAHLFSVIKGNENILMIYGDTFFQKNILKDVLNAFQSNGLSVVSLLPTHSGIDDVDFVIRDRKIISVIPCSKQLFEPTQVFLFNTPTCRRIAELVKRGINRFDIMYKYLLKESVFNVIECMQNECINVNERADVDKITHFSKT